MAVILLNKNACSETGLGKWKSIQSDIRKQLGSFETIIASDNTDKEIATQLKSGNTFFIAAGGDGTVNYLLNSIARNTLGAINHVIVGAIGLGSSNDFHKPFKQEQFINGIPCKINPDTALSRTIGRIVWWENNSEYQSFWINNASIGVTAEANFLFNHPSLLLNILKKASTNAAILYAAISTIISYSNFPGDLLSDEQGYRNIELTNLGVVINPHFSGSMHYDSPFLYDSNKFFVHTMAGLKLLPTLHVLYRLSQGKFAGIKNTESYQTSRIAVRSQYSFAVEYDGETIKTNNVEFSVKQNAVQICT